MKGKNPTRKQKTIIRNNGFNPDNWLVLKIVKEDEKRIMYMKHKTSNKPKKITI